MSNKPVFIAAVLTVLAGVPLYFLSSQQFQLGLSNLPIIVLSLFVLLLISAFWSKTTPPHSNFEDYDQSERESGNVKWFNANKGFGFITRDSGEDVFVHFRSIRGEGHRVLHDGQRVEFIVCEGEKGLQAEDVATAP